MRTMEKSLATHRRQRCRHAQPTARLPQTAGSQASPINQNRWYDAAVGRWLSQDPLGLGPDANPYRYCGNAPTDGMDSSGLDGVVMQLAYKAQSTWDRFLNRAPVGAGYGQALWWDSATRTFVQIGTAPAEPSAGPGDPPTYGAITLDDKFGGGTLTSPQAAIAKDLSQNPANARTEGESQDEYIKRIIACARNNIGETMSARQAREEDHDKKVMQMVQKAAQPPPEMSAAYGWHDGMTEEQKKQWEEDQKEAQEAAEELVHGVRDLQEAQRTAGEVPTEAIPVP